MGGERIPKSESSEGRERPKEIIDVGRLEIRGGPYRSTPFEIPLKIEITPKMAEDKMTIEEIQKAIREALLSKAELNVVVDLGMKGNKGLVLNLSSAHFPAGERKKLERDINARYQE